MPNYRYKCDMCGSDTEELRLISERHAPLTCTEAHCDGLMRFVMSGGNFKVWHYEAWRMDAAADARKCGVEW